MAQGRATAAKTSETNYEDLFNQLPGAHIVMYADDPDFTIAAENKAHADLALVDGEIAVGRPLFDVFPDTSEKYVTTGVSDLVESFRRVIKTKKPDALETLRYDLRGKAGLLETRYWKVTHYPILDKKGRVDLIVQDTKDITDEISVSRQLHRVENQLEQALNIGQVGSWVWDIKDDAITADKNLARLFGITTKQKAIDLPLKQFTEAIHPEDRKRVTKAIEQTVATNGTFEQEYRTITATGEVRWVLARGRIEVEEPSGRLTFPGVIVDITENKRTDLNLRFLSNASKALAASLDSKKTLYNLAKLSVPDMSDWCAIDMFDESGTLQQVAVAHRDPKRVAWAKKLRASQPIDLTAPNGVPKVLRTGQPEFYPVITDELLERSAKNAEELKRLRELGFRSVMIIPLKLEEKPIGAVTFVSTESGRYYSEADYEVAQELGLRASLAMTNAKLYQTARNELHQRERLEAELRLVNEELESRVARRTAELQETNTNLERSNQELQDFAYVASHDLQEPLRKIQAFSNLLASEYASQLGDGQDYLERMKNAASRMSSLIEDLLSFSRVTTKARPFEPVDLQTIAYEVVGDLETRLSESGGQVNYKNLPTILADPVQMRQLLQNLIGNALKFARDDVPPIVTVSASVKRAKDGTIGTCTLKVSDNGIGFNEKYRDRIFAVFQRLHGRERYQGTGIGLAICRKIAERHGGDITATSKLGSGSTFIITLKARNPKSQESAA